MESEKNIISDITIYIPIVTVLATLFGLVDSMVYYSRFNLNIFQYFEVTDIFMNSLLGFMLLTVTGVSYFFLSLYVKKEAYEKFMMELVELPSVWAIIKTASKKHLVRFLPAFIMLIPLLLFFYFAKHPLIDAFVIFFTIISWFVFLFFVFVGFNHLYFDLYKKLPVYQYRLVFFTFSTIVISGLIYGMFRSAMIKGGNCHLKDNIVFNGKPLPISDTYYYIGKSNSYVFFYDEKIKNTDIYPIDKVDRIISTFCQ
jgi:hypothetical protein